MATKKKVKKVVKKVNPHKDCKSMAYCQSIIGNCKHQPNPNKAHFGKKKKKKVPKYEVKVKIPTTRGDWEFWL